MPNSERTGRIRIGRYALEVGAPAGTLITAQADIAADPTPLAQALKTERRDHETPGAVEHALEAASEATARAEEAVDLFHATVEGSLLDPGQVSGRIDLMLELLQRLDREGRWEEALRVARAINGLLALAMRWMDLVRSLRIALNAAERLGDSQAIGWVQHELGTLHLAGEDSARAEEHLAEAQATRRRIGDREGLRATEHNLGVLCRQLRELLRGGRLQQRSGSPRRLLLALVAAVLLLLVGAVAGAVVDPRGGDAGEVIGATRLRVHVEGPGKVTSRPAGISCPDRCERDFALRSRILLTPEPGDDATFVGWRGACDGTDPCRLRLRNDKSVVARFRNVSPTATATLRVDRPLNGSVISSPAGIDCGGQCANPFPLGKRVTLTAQPGEGYGLNKWIGPCEGTGPCILKMDTDQKVSADFRALRTITVTIEILGGASGTVTSVPSGIQCSSGTCAAEFLANRDEVSLSATEEFTGWRGDCAGELPTCSLSLESDHEAIAVFGIE